jgi:hypothetical protein
MAVFDSFLTVFEDADNRYVSDCYDNFTGRLYRVLAAVQQRICFPAAQTRVYHSKVQRLGGPPWDLRNRSMPS